MATDPDSRAEAGKSKPLRRTKCESTAPYLPGSRNRAQGGLDEGRVLGAGVAEVDEPLAVDGPRHLLQHLNLPPIVFDQVVNRIENDADPVLITEFWEQEPRDSICDCHMWGTVAPVTMACRYL